MRASLAAALVAGGLAAALAAPAPPGPLIVYEKTVSGNMDLYLVPVSGGPERRLTDDPAEDALPRFAPDGRSVVFSSKRTGAWQVWQVPVGGGPARRLRASASADWQADVSPDGRSIVFLSDAGGTPALWLQDLRTRAERRLVRHGPRTILGNPHWSPDGSSIVFSSNFGFPGHRVHVIEVASGSERRVSPLTSGACEPCFSPDGRRVAYVRRQHLTRERSRIVEADLASGEERDLVAWPALNYDPAYSPDGKELAFVSTVAGDFAVFRLRLSDGQAWRVSFGKGVDRHPAYQPAAR